MMPQVEYYLKALEIFENLADKYGIVTSCTGLGIIYTKLHSYNLAHEYLNISLPLACEIGAKGLEIFTLISLSELFEAEADFEQALQYHKRYTDLEKKIFKEW